jgi:1-phosphofructokinase family hexose kinase
MILCVTPNPALDRTMTVPGLRLGEVGRATGSFIAAGGKGLNVARVVRTLGGTALCGGLLGGHSGQLLADLAEREGLPAAWTWFAGETRTSIILLDPQGGDATVVNEPGPPVASDDWARLTADVLRAAEGSDFVCLSGSLPPGSTPELFATLLRSLVAAGRPVWVDTSGAALAAALAVDSVGIKVNGAEAAQIVGHSIEHPSTALAAARELQHGGSRPIILTLGERGAVMAGAVGGWHAQPPALRIVSSVGSGDAFLAGLAVALARGLTEPEALRQAVAAGAANALTVGGGHLELDDFQTILEQTTSTRMEESTNNANVRE